MKFRKKVNFKKSKRGFKKTANRTKSANVRSAPMRGGIRM
jgi:hypothetical protein